MDMGIRAKLDDDFGQLVDGSLHITTGNACGERIELGR
jgi:hypothetical protein